MAIRRVDQCGIGLPIASPMSHWSRAQEVPFPRRRCRFPDGRRLTLCLGRDGEPRHPDHWDTQMLNTDANNGVADPTAGWSTRRSIRLTATEYAENGVARRCGSMTGVRVTNRQDIADVDRDSALGVPRRQGDALPARIGPPAGSQMRGLSLSASGHSCCDQHESRGAVNEHFGQTHGTGCAVPRADDEYVLVLGAGGAAETSPRKRLWTTT